MDFESIRMAERVEKQDIKLERGECNDTGAFSYDLGVNVPVKKNNHEAGPNMLLGWLLEV